MDRNLKSAVLLSVAAHFAFLAVSVFWRLPGTPSDAAEIRRMFRLSPEAIPDEAPRRQVIQSYTEKLRFENPLVEPSVAGEVELPEEVHIADKREIAQGSSPRRIAGDQTLAKENVIVVPKKIDSPSEADRFRPRESTADAEEVDVPGPFLEKMFAFTPAAAPRETEAGTGDLLSGTADKIFKGKGKSGSRDRLMDFNVSTWRDPRDGRGYYEIRIRPGRDAGKMESLPKEVQFLVDSSLSIRGYRIDEFTKGIVYCLRNLNSKDRVNIYTFKEDIRAFAPGSRPSSDPALLGDGIRFLNALVPSEKTDIYDALSVVTEAKPGLMPSYVVLLSDGRPTQGMTSSERIIAELTRRNSGTRSVFAFSGGKRVNRYLLDFLSYQNRGWSEYAVNGLKIRAKIQEFYDKIRDPLLHNLRYQLAWLPLAASRQDGSVPRSARADATENVYPRHLPDFFRNAEFAIYGTFEEEGEFSLRIVGEARGREKDVIFTGNLAKAERGGPAIGTGWAANKVYYLIGRMTLEGTDPAAENEVLELSRKFDLKTPYAVEQGR